MFFLFFFKISNEIKFEIVSIVLPDFEIIKNNFFFKSIFFFILIFLSKSISSKNKPAYLFTF